MTSLLYIQEVFAMNEIKKLDKKQMTQNVCSLLVKSGEPFESIALYLGISDRLIYYWQEGKRSPNLEHIYGISQLLGVSVESILNWGCFLLLNSCSWRFRESCVIMKSLLTRRFISWAKEKVYPVILIPVVSLTTMRIRTTRTTQLTERITTIAPIRWIPTTKLTSKAVVAMAKTANEFQSGSPIWWTALFFSLPRIKFWLYRIPNSAFISWISASSLTSHSSSLSA